MATNMDIETVKTVAELAATSAVSKVGEQLRGEMAAGFNRLEQSMQEYIKTGFKLHFGGMEPSEHIIEHKRMHSVLQMADTAKKSFLKTATAKVTEWLIVLCIAGAAVKMGLPAAVAH